MKVVTLKTRHSSSVPVTEDDPSCLGLPPTSFSYYLHVFCEVAAQLLKVEVDIR